MTPLPAPPDDPDIVWRPPTIYDAPGLTDHTRLIHLAEGLEFLPGAEFFRWLLTQPGIDPRHDMLVAVADGSIVADAGTWLHRADTGARCTSETRPRRTTATSGRTYWSGRKLGVAGASTMSPVTVPACSASQSKSTGRRTERQSKQPDSNPRVASPMWRALSPTSLRPRPSRRDRSRHLVR